MKWLCYLKGTLANIARLFLLGHLWRTGLYARWSTTQFTLHVCAWLYLLSGGLGVEDEKNCCCTFWPYSM